MDNAIEQIHDGEKTLYDRLTSMKIVSAPLSYLNNKYNSLKVTNPYCLKF